MAVVTFGESSPVNLRIETLFTQQFPFVYIPGGDAGNERAIFSYSLDAVLPLFLGEYVGTYFGGDIGPLQFHTFRVGAGPYTFTWTSDTPLRPNNMLMFQNNGGTSAAQLMAGSDDITGSSHADFLEGYGGHDLIKGGGGDDTLVGSGGNDQLFGDAGADAINGGTGVDFARYDTTLSGGVIVSLDAGAGYAGDALGDVIAADVEGVVGSGFADIIVGGAGDNQIFGSFGGDYLFGLGGVDIMYGDGGADLLYGGAGIDFLVGGADADSFVTIATDVAANVYDYVYDFADGLDVILLQGWNPASLFMFESGGHTFITSADVGYAGGVIVLNSTLAQVQDQVLVV